ncbi:hypothetical protein [Phytopseudomonas flavescens]|uniref:hypothetical protein n=1 Tax=Phytopseudomonas flavescens TaxID=29435 RepID=UPI000A050DF3|nr:hypothetical protein [Pseudomonas flavescens]
MFFEYSDDDGITLFDRVRERSKVRELMGGHVRVFPKTEFSENSTDVFGDVFAKVWYSADNNVSGVQLYDPDAKFYYAGKQILGLSLGEVRNFLNDSRIDFAYEEDGSGIVIEDGRVRIYIPDSDEYGELAKVEAVYIDIPSLHRE